METSHALPDVAGPHLKLLIVGTAAGTASAARGHYYAGPGNRMWEILHGSGMTPRRLRPEEDFLLPEYGIGLTDLNKTVAQSHDRGLVFDVPGFVANLERWRPAVVAFHGKKSAKTVARHLRKPVPDWGELDWTIANSRLFVVPQTSGANQHASYGRHSRIEGWWSELALMIASS